MTETIKYYELKLWGWDCPCGQFNETDNNPNYADYLFCDECGKKFTDFEEE